MKKNKLIIIAITVFTFLFLSFGGDEVLKTATTNTLNFLKTTFSTTRKEIKEVTFETDKYQTNTPGDYKVVKKASWTEKNTATIEFNIDTKVMTNNRKKDIIFVLDRSGSMIGEKYEKLASDANELLTELLKDKSNTASLITFSDNATILKTYSNDANELISMVNAMEIIGGTNYYEALGAVDEVLSQYQVKEDRDCVVVFLTDGFPTVDNSNQIAEFQVVTNKYSFVKIHGIQYEMGKEITEELKQVSHKQYSIDIQTLRNVLFEATFQPIRYDDFELVDYISDNFIIESVDDIKASIGNVRLEEENGQQKVVWSVKEDEMFSGTAEKLTIKVKLKNDLANEDGYYATNKQETVKATINGVEKNVSSNLSPVLQHGYKVTYDMNTPKNCSLENIDGGTHYAYETIELNSTVPKCKNYTFVGWETEEEIKYVNDDYYIMPTHDLTFKAVWSSFDISKTMNGEIYKVLTLYDTLKKQSVLDNKASEFVISANGIDFSKTSSDTNGKGIYTLAETASNQYPIYYFRGAVNNNNVIFAGYCWKIVRTTETGGIKMIYNGVPSANNTCENTGTATQISTKGFNATQTTPGHLGYMYNTVYSYKSTDYLTSASSTILQSKAITTDYYYGDNFTYNSETGEYSLTNSEKLSWNENYNKLSGKYTCLTENETCSTLYYISGTSDTTAYYISITGGNKLENLDTLTVGKSYKDNGDGTYTIQETSVINKYDWFNKYQDLKGYYICSDQQSTTCSTLRFMLSTSEASYTYLNSDKNYIYGNSVSYEDGVYTLKDTKTLWELAAGDKDLGSNHYTCLTLNGTCTSVNYIYLIESNKMYYYQLTNGTDFETMYDSMLLNDNVNKTSSTIKTEIDKWYGNNMTAYTKYLENTTFCNDRSASELGGWDPNGTLPITNNYLIFDALRRQNGSNPSLACNKTDAFTLSVENGGTAGYGNNALKYPVALLSSDEVIYAGGTWSANKNYYLYTGQYYWILTPYRFRDYRSSGYLVYEDGSLNGGYTKNAMGVRPVISLKNDVLYDKGNGTPTKPYIILQED